MGAEREEASQKAETPPRASHAVLVAVDGCHAPERDGWHEVKVGVVTDAGFRVEKPPSQGECARAKAEGRDPRGRECLLRKAYVASRHSLEEFKQRVWDEALRWDVERALACGVGRRRRGVDLEHGGGVVPLSSRTRASCARTDFRRRLVPRLRTLVAGGRASFWQAGLPLGANMGQEAGNPALGEG